MRSGRRRSLLASTEVSGFDTWRDTPSLEELVAEQAQREAEGGGDGQQGA